MTYEAAPATSLLATSCLCCGRPLLDAASVTAGVGPVCRKKYGYTAEITEENRVAANVLIHEAALEGCLNERRAEIADELEALGLEKLAGKVRDRFMKPDVRIEHRAIVFGKGQWARTVEGAIFVKTSFNPAFNTAFKANIDWRDRAPVFVEKNGKQRFAGWGVKPGAKRALWATLIECFAGKALQTPAGGVTYIPSK